MMEPLIGFLLEEIRYRSRASVLPYIQANSDVGLAAHNEWVDNADRDRRALIAEIDRLRAGEDTTPIPANAYPNAGQWIHRFNTATEEERLTIADHAIENAADASHCYQAHPRDPAARTLGNEPPQIIRDTRKQLIQVFADDLDAEVFLDALDAYLTARETAR